MKIKEWGAFALLGLIWGTSFLWIKIAVEDVTPLVLVAFRLSFGLIGLLAVMAVQRRAFPREPKVLGMFFILSIFQTALPFVLISWGETRIDSALAAILNATVPLFTIVIAHFWQADDKITAGRILGLGLGFVGVVVLVSRDVGPAGFTGNALGQVAVLAASLSYAFAVNFTHKKFQGFQPVVQSSMTLLFAAAQIWAVTLGDAVLRASLIATPAAAPLIALPSTWQTWFALAWLGLLGSCVAYLLFFHLINTWGATRASVVTYVFPVIGLILGIVFRGEAVDWRLVVGSLLVVIGIVAVNLKLRRRPSPETALAAE